MTDILFGDRCCCRITVARFTVIYDTRMIKYRWFKGAGCVTGTAVLCGWEVTTIFLGPDWSRCSGITMTGCAITHNASMIKGAIVEIVVN